MSEDAAEGKPAKTERLKKVVKNIADALHDNNDPGDGTGAAITAAIHVVRLLKAAQIGRTRGGKNKTPEKEK